MEGHTPFHIACKYGQLKIAEMIIQLSIDLNIDLNTKDFLWELTGFHLACESGHLKITEMLVQYSAEFNIDISMVTIMQFHTVVCVRELTKPILCSK